MIAELLTGMAVGSAVGALFFAGLWWTVRGVVRSDRPALWLLLSMLGRGALAIGGFWLVVPLGPLPIGCALVAFLGARTIATWLVRIEPTPARSES